MAESEWPAGSVFAIGWLVLWMPIFIIAMIWFHARSDFQPIKARSPALVLVTDMILLLYTLSLCMQRVASASYPCVVNLLSGYIGTVVLFNAYLWRCWTLYFNFNLTHVRLQMSETNHDNFFIKNRWMTSGAFLSKIAVGVFLVLMIPPIALTGTHTFIATEYGDGCNQSWGPTLLAVYVACYVALFSWFSFSLRSVVDGFKIKVELKVTGFIALMAVIPWFVFNTYASRINTDTFPFSTLCLLIAIVAAFMASTIYPLYSSVFGQHSSNIMHQTRKERLMRLQSYAYLKKAQSDNEDSQNSQSGTNTDEDSLSLSQDMYELKFDRLSDILKEPSGCETFKQFLTKEFSVENIVFYLDVEKLRTEIRAAMDIREADGHKGLGELGMKFAQKSKNLYTKYIASDAPYQVNLPDHVVKNCEAHLRFEAHLHGIEGPPRKRTKVGQEEIDDWSIQPPPQSAPLDHVDRSTPTVFDDAQRTIYLLMEKDSMLRFVRSDLYKEWFENIKLEEYKNKVLAEMNLV